MDDVWPDDTLLELQGLARGGTGPAPGANSTPAVSNSPAVPDPYVGISGAVRSSLEKLVNSKIANRNKEIENLNPVTGAIRRSLGEGGAIDKGLPFYIEYNPVYSLLRELGVAPSPYVPNKFLGIQDPMKDAPVFREPVAGGGAAAWPAASVLWSLIRRKGGAKLLENLASAVGAGATSSLFFRHVPQISFAEEAVRKNLGPIESLINSVRGTGVDANGNPISRPKSLSNAVRGFFNIGKNRLRSSPLYRRALEGQRGLQPSELLQERLADLVVDPGTSLNTAAASMGDTMQADFDLSRIMGYDLANATTTNAVRAGQMLRPLYKNPRAGGLTMKNVQDMSALGARQGFLGTGESLDVLSYIQNRLPANIRNAMINRTKLRGKMQLMDPSIKPQVERATGYKVPLSPYQRALQDIRGTSPAEYPSYPSGQKGGYRLGEAYMNRLRKSYRKGIK